MIAVFQILNTVIFKFSFVFLICNIKIVKIFSLWKNSFFVVYHKLLLCRWDKKKYIIKLEALFSNKRILWKAHNNIHLKCTSCIHSGIQMIKSCTANLSSTSLQNLFLIGLSFLSFIPFIMYCIYFYFSNNTSTFRMKWVHHLWSIFNFPVSSLLEINLEWFYICKGN